MNIVDDILDKSAKDVRLSRRALYALLILSEGSADGPVFSNQTLQWYFTKQKLSSDASVQKDASAAKGELFGAEYVKVAGKLSRFEISDLGRTVVAAIDESVLRGIEEADLSSDEKDILRTIMSMPATPFLSELGPVAVKSGPTVVIPGRTQKNSRFS